MTQTFEIKSIGEALKISKDGTEMWSIEFGCPIRQFIACDLKPRAFVLTEPKRGQDLIDNLTCVDVANGCVKWTKSASKARSANNSFTEIQLDSPNGRLTAWDWDGYRYIFDSDTGEEIESHFFK